MKSRMAIIHGNGFITLTGACDEHVNLSPLLSLAPPLKLNFSGMTSINSIGIRQWLTFVQQWGEKTLELYECPPCFIEAVNVFESMLGSVPEAHRIKSMLVPYTCELCEVQGVFSVKTAEVKVRNGTAFPPLRACLHCGGSARITKGFEDLFFFLTCAPTDAAD